jgi:bifunctional UDP-N-acetylglucosamine pyrophosphorylase/glucosamine-1-phosphate N-acetyltransferase
MTQSSALAIVLAAGKGTRMKSDLPKVLHRIAGAPMLAHVLQAGSAAGIARGCLVVGPNMEAVGEAGQAVDAGLDVFVQPEQLGTADAVKAALPALEAGQGPILVLYGDTPLLRAETLKAVVGELDAGADLVVVGFEADDPTGYGRLLFDEEGRLAGIREEKDASTAERALTLCNSGIVAFRSGETLKTLLARIGNDNAKGEYYLTDAVSLARADGLHARVVLSNAEEVLGVNSRAELAVAEAAMQMRLRNVAMAHGVTLIAPETVFFSYDTAIGRDVVIQPNVIIGPGVTIDDGATRTRTCTRAPKLTTSPTSVTQAWARRLISVLERSRVTMTDSPNIVPRSARAPSSARTVRWSRRSRSETAPLSVREASLRKTCPRTRSPFPACRNRTTRVGRARCGRGARATSPNRPLCFRISIAIKGHSS